MSEPGLGDVGEGAAGAYGSRIAGANQTNPSAIQQYQMQMNQSQQKSGHSSMRASVQHQQQAAKPIQKTNVLTGAASTSYQLPVIWAGQYMGLVGYQVQKENEENEKRLKQLQELAKQATLKKAEKKKTNLSLPMRGRHMYIGDKTRDQYMRCEVLQQANENDAANLVINKARFLEHVQKFEDQIRNNRVETTTSQVQGLDSEGLKGLPKRSLRDFKPLKARTFMFDKSGVGGPNR